MRKRWWQSLKSKNKANIPKKPICNTDTTNRKRRRINIQQKNVLSKMKIKEGNNDILTIFIYNNAAYIFDIYMYNWC